MIYQLLGSVLILLGFTHRFNSVNQIDKKAVKSIQAVLHKKPWLPFIQEIWFFGRTTFALITLALLISLKWKLGVSAFLVFLVAVGIEQILKILFNRPRPFAEDQDIRMLQPSRPHDPSFPSGDALRVWYLALILPTAAGGIGLFLPAVILVAMLVTLGRIGMGVHYPTDTITGLGLGLMAAGTTLWLWQYFGFL